MRQRVIIVDEERKVTENIDEMLNEQYEVIKVNSGKEAFEKLREIKPDIMLIDLSMKRMSGWKLISKIRAIREYSEISFIVLTDKPDFNIVERGIEHYIVKPVSRKELISTIEVTLNAKAKVMRRGKKIKASDSSKELLTSYEAKLNNLISNQRLLWRLRQIFNSKKMEENENHLNMMKSFELAIDLERAEVQKLQIDIQRTCNTNYFIR